MTFRFRFCESVIRPVVLGPILRLIAQYLAGVINVHPAPVVVRHAPKDVKAQRVVGSDTFLSDLDDVAHADENAGSLGWARPVSLDLTMRMTMHDIPWRWE